MSFVLFSLTEQNIFQNKTKKTNKKISTFQHFFLFFLDDKDKCVQIFK